MSVGPPGWSSCALAAGRAMGLYVPGPRLQPLPPAPGDSPPPTPMSTPRPSCRHPFTPSRPCPLSQAAPSRDFCTLGKGVRQGRGQEMAGGEGSAATCPTEPHPSRPVTQPGDCRGTEAGGRRAPSELRGAAAPRRSGRCGGKKPLPAPGAPPPKGPEAAEPLRGEGGRSGALSPKSAGSFCTTPSPVGGQRAGCTQVLSISLTEEEEKNCPKVEGTFPFLKKLHILKCVSILPP